MIRTSRRTLIVIEPDRSYPDLLDHEMFNEVLKKLRVGEIARPVRAGRPGNPQAIEGNWLEFSYLWEALLLDDHRPAELRWFDFLLNPYRAAKALAKRMLRVFIS